MSRKPSYSVDLDYNKHEHLEHLLEHTRVGDEKHRNYLNRNSSPRIYSCQLMLILVGWFILPFLVYRVGFSNGFNKAAPPLPLDVALGDYFELQVQQLDDNFEVRHAENRRYKGQPRPELDHAWNELIKYMNVRIHPDEARAADFDSVEILDGSGDLFATPVVFHNLHCLMQIRRFLFPNVYVAGGRDPREMPDEIPGVIPDHIDHCIDNLRQAVMCHGDMSMYRVKWREEEPIPKPMGLMPHRCINWDKMMDWAGKRSFDLYEYGLQTGEPKFSNFTMPYTVINYTAVVHPPWH